MRDQSPDADAIRRAAQLVAEADGLLVTAGAGMGVDSGLPDFRGPEGFWKAYPALGWLGIDFTEIASPAAFDAEPRLAWGFYGHRLKLYRATRPHEGFAILQRLAQGKPRGLRVFTSNVDGQFQKAGIRPEHVAECHGSIHHLQCLADCGQPVWSADTLEPHIDEDSCKWLGELPACPRCGDLARPNILMFGDYGWIGRRYDEAEVRVLDWAVKAKRLVVIEIGAGTAIPSVRRFGEARRVPLVRINVREAGVGREGDVSFAAGALAALQGISAHQSIG